MIIKFSIFFYGLLLFLMYNTFEKQNIKQEYYKTGELFREIHFNDSVIYGQLYYENGFLARKGTLQINEAGDYRYDGKWDFYDVDGGAYAYSNEYVDGVPYFDTSKLSRENNYTITLISAIPKRNNIVYCNTRGELKVKVEDLSPMYYKVYAVKENDSCLIEDELHRINNDSSSIDAYPLYEFMITEDMVCTDSEGKTFISFVIEFPNDSMEFNLEDYDIMDLYLNIEK